MWLLVLATVITLGTLVGAGIGLEWFDEFPSQWEWFFGILSVVAFVFGSVVLPQVIWGKPRLEITFHTETAEGQRHIGLMFYNRPLRNKILRNLGIYRMGVQSLAVTFRMVEVGTNKLLFPNRSGLLKTDESFNPEEVFNRVALPPTFSVGAETILARWDYRNGQALVPPDGLRSELALVPGQYMAEIIIFVDGFEHRIVGQFVVDADPSSLAWIEGLSKATKL